MPSTGNTHSANQALDSVRDRIHRAARACGRDPALIRLLAVSKRQPLDRVAAVVAAGQKALGENQVQEALEKMPRLPVDIEWHFVGQLQSNKTRDVARHFAWVHSVDRPKLLRRLSSQRPDDIPPLDLCLQLKVGKERSKGGALEEDLEDLAALAASLPRLRLRGLMAIPPPELEFARQRAHFAQVRHAFEHLSGQHPGLDTLSMGMSADLEAAVAEGATMVRVGTDLFGPRP